MTFSRLSDINKLSEICSISSKLSDSTICNNSSGVLASPSKINRLYSSPCWKVKVFTKLVYPSSLRMVRNAFCNSSTGADVSIRDNSFALSGSVMLSKLYWISSSSSPPNPSLKDEYFSRLVTLSNKFN